MLAGASIYNKDLDTASIAYAALNEVNILINTFNYQLKNNYLNKG